MRWSLTVTKPLLVTWPKWLPLEFKTKLGTSGFPQLPSSRVSRRVMTFGQILCKLIRPKSCLKWPEKHWQNCINFSKLATINDCFGDHNCHRSDKSTQARRKSECLCKLMKIKSVHHLRKKISGNFGWTVNGKAILVCPTARLRTNGTSWYFKVTNKNTRTEMPF